MIQNYSRMTNNNCHFFRDGLLILKDFYQYQSVNVAVDWNSEKKLFEKTNFKLETFFKTMILQISP